MNRAVVVLLVASCICGAVADNCNYNWVTSDGQTKYYYPPTPVRATGLLISSSLLPIACICTYKYSFVDEKLIVGQEIGQLMQIMAKPQIKRIGVPQSLWGS